MSATVLLFCLSAAAQVREKIEWLDVWLPDTNSHALPRVLLVGDSITRGYGKQVEAGLAGRAYVARLATSKSLGDPALLEQVSLVLREQTFDVIHFNNGMHGDGYSEDEYAAALPTLLTALRSGAPSAKLIFCTTTDVRERNRLENVLPKTERMVKRNALLREFAKREKIPVNDLYEVVREHPEFHAADGVHFNEQGNTAMSAQVVASVLKLLTPSPAAQHCDNAESRSGYGHGGGLGHSARVSSLACGALQNAAGILMFRCMCRYFSFESRVFSRRNGHDR